MSWSHELVRYTGLGPRDAEILHRYLPAVEGHFPAIVEDFYSRILNNEGARRFLREGEGQIERLKRSLRSWLEGLFGGNPDAEYWERLARIADTHVRIGLPIPYVVGAMNHIRLRLAEALRAATRADPGLQTEVINALHRLLDVELGVMLEGYESRRLAAAAARHREDVATIDDAARRVTGERTLAEVLDHALDDLRSRTGAEMGGIYLLEEDRLRLAASRGLPASFPERVSREMAERWAFLSAEGIAQGPAPGAANPGACSALSVPILRDGRWLGTVLLASGLADRFREESLPFLRAMASQIGIGIEYLLLYDRLRASEAHFRAIVETAPEYIWTMNRDGRASYLNRGFLGFSREELLARGLPGTRELFVDGTLGKFERALGKVFDFGEAVLGLRVRLRPPEGGEARAFVGNLAPLWGAGREVEEALGVFRDVTDEERLRDDLVRSERLAAVGEMAATIAHEVRNPLAAAKGVLEILAERFPADSEERFVVAETVERFDTLARLIADLLVFSRPIEPQLRKVEASSLVRDLAEGLRREESLRGIDIREEVDGKLRPVAVDDVLLWMAVLNLANNAAQAMEGKGGITLRAEGAGGRIAIRVKDRGPGIPPEIRGRLFTPFTSTKRRGTGLGLAMVKRIAEAHGGAVDAEDRRGGGAVFSILLPPVEV